MKRNKKKLKGDKTEMKGLKVLVIGSGGREGALVALIGRSPMISQNPQVIFTRDFERFVEEKR